MNAMNAVEGILVCCRIGTLSGPPVYRLNGAKVKEMDGLLLGSFAGTFEGTTIGSSLGRFEDNFVLASDGTAECETTGVLVDFKVGNNESSRVGELLWTTASSWEGGKVRWFEGISECKYGRLVPEAIISLGHREGAKEILFEGISLATNLVSLEGI